MKHYKTTLLGLVLAVSLSIQPLMDNGEFDLKRDWQRLVISVIIAITGYFMKDPKSIS